MKKLSAGLLLGAVAAAFVATAGVAFAQEDSTCMAGFNTALSMEQQRHPRNSQGSMHDQYQYAAAFAVSALEILDDFRSCLSPSDYQANRQQLEQARDAGIQGCMQVASGSGSCQPRYPGE